VSKNPERREGAAAAVLDEQGRILLIRQNYGVSAYGFPGGRLDLGEAPEQAVIRETFEETGLAIHVEHLVGVYELDEGRSVTSVFRCSVLEGDPFVRDPAEIAEVGWFKTGELPRPRMDELHHALPDVLVDARGVVRLGLPRIN
jgi:8-oxo-dGTP diphosphatase